MSDDIIIKLVQDTLMGAPKEDIRVLFSFSDDKDKAKATSAYRLIMLWYAFKNGKASSTDFECCLRDYLLILKTKIVLPGYQLSSPNMFGLSKNDISGSIYVNYDLPEYINKGFTSDVFSMVMPKKRKQNNYLINTPPFIKDLTGFERFKSIDQQLAVMGALKVPEGYTALVSMLTGGGKSLITQAVSYQHEEGLSLIIVPTISLMLDQVRSARNTIRSDTENEIFCYYHKAKTYDEMIEAMHDQRARMIFLSPETLIKNQKLREEVFKVARSGYLKNLIIDEAHIIIEWGSSFRVDFQCLDAFRRALIEEAPGLRTYLLSATFSKRTVEQLKMYYSDRDNWIELRFDKLRKEPRFNIIKCSSYTEKHRRMKELVCKLPHPMIIYVNTPDDAVKVQKELCDIGFLNTRIFTGKTRADERNELISQWINNEFEIMIATCAFGVGVDKKDVRTVMHLYVPNGPNQYYQECGRGGRDGLPCLSILLYTDDDLNVAFGLTEKVLTAEKLSGRWFSMLNSRLTEKKLGYIRLDTSVKPSYNESDDFYTLSSNTDVAWNVYVVLLLRRAGKLTILDVEYIDDKYIFTVRINDTSIMYQTEETQSSFSQIRENEKETIRSEFSALRKALSATGKECWSQMFNEVYALTDEYCLGCDHHEEPIDGEGKGLPLKKAVTGPCSPISEKLSSLMNGAKELLVIGEHGPDMIINGMINAAASMIVLSEETLETVSISDAELTNTTVQLIGYDEFFELCSRNHNYYLSGCILFVLGDDAELAFKVMNAVRAKDMSTVFYTNGDIYISKRGKTISELINGPCKLDHIFEKELLQ